MRISWERFCQMDSGDFPMTGGAVFSSGPRDHESPRAARRRGWRNALQRSDVAESKALETWERQPAQRARDIAERVAPCVAIVRRIGRFADSDAVENDDYRA